MTSFNNTPSTPMKNLYVTRQSSVGIMKPKEIRINRHKNIQLTFHNSVTILYVEDSVLNQELARKVFESLGCCIKIAVDGFEALEMITKERFDMIFMDIDMPRINGYEATRIIRENLCLKTPIIALTSLDSETDIENCIQAGMNSHMAKPLNKVELTHTVYRWNRRN